MLDRLEFLDKIGQGGMAEVYRAFLKGDYGFKKELVVKKILNEHFNNQRFLKMFVDEASVTSKLNHSNIVQVYDFFEEKGNLYILMEYIKGSDLRIFMNEHIIKQTYIPIEHVLYILNELLNGMNYYHNRRDEKGNPLKIIHRDFTPKNILLSIHGDVKIGDFGIAQFEDKLEVTTFGEIKGKPSYLSPEQLKLLPELDGRVDLFALGVIFYELLANQHPFRDKSQVQTQQNILQGKFNPIENFRSVPKDILKILYKLLENNRERRYQTSYEVQRDILALKHSISTQISFSRYLVQTVRPDDVDFIENIASVVEKHSDYRFFKPKITNNIIKYSIIAFIVIDLFVITFSLFNTSPSKNNSNPIFNTQLRQNQLINDNKPIEIRPKVIDDTENIGEDEFEFSKNSDMVEKKIENIDKIQTTKNENIKEKKNDINKIDLDKNRDKTTPKKIEKVKDSLKTTKTDKIDGFGTVDIHVIPYASIYIDGKLVDEVSIKNYKLEAGKHILKITNDAFGFSKTQNIEILPDKKSVFRFQIE
ncbi:serine/threonine protein kinase [bacterium]|nr:serine/threonine protein kinase [bacterium]